MVCNTSIGRPVPTGDLVGTTDTQTITNKSINIDTGGNSIVGTTWSVLYTDGSGIFTELALGTAGQVLQSNGPSVAPSFATAAGGGNVSNTGTPVDNQLAIWTNATTIEGDAALTFDTATDTLAIGASGKLAFGAVDIISDAAGVTTLSNIDATDATTKSTIANGITALSNITSIQEHTFTLTGDFIRSGAHSLTLTTTGATSVTLPTSGFLDTVDFTVQSKASGFTLALSDSGTFIGMTNAASADITVPPQSSVTWRDGATLIVLQGGAGAVNIVGGAGVTVVGNTSTTAQYQARQLVRLASDSWVVIG